MQVKILTSFVSKQGTQVPGAIVELEDSYAAELLNAKLVEPVKPKREKAVK